MSNYESKRVDFMLTVFTELNEHIRATDEKNVMAAGTFVALIAVVIAIIIEKITEISWLYFGFSVIILVIGFYVYMLQLWFREWKEHYLQICYNIASNFEQDEKLLPFWLRKRKKKSFSVDKFLVMMTLFINAVIVLYSVYLLYNLVWLQLIGKIAISVCFIVVYFLLIIAARYFLITRYKDKGGILPA